MSIWAMPGSCGLTYRVLPARGTSTPARESRKHGGKPGGDGAHAPNYLASYNSYIVTTPCPRGMYVISRKHETQGAADEPASETGAPPWADAK